MALLEVEGLTKRFGATLALDDVSFRVEASRFHSLVGENGAGKSTLIKSLMGVYAPDHGAFTLDGQPYASRNPLDATRQGIAAIYQEPSVATELSVAENILMGNLPTRSGMVHNNTVISVAQEMIDKLGVDLRADTPASDISASQRVLLGLVRALSSNPRLLICDEPTAHFSPEQADHLFGLLRHFLNEGNAILYISHRLEEVLEQSDDVTVLRDGRHVETLAAAGLTERELIRRMVGRYQENLYPVLDTPGDKPRLEVQDYTLAGSNASVNLSVAEGEVVGLYGLVGAGRSDLLRGIFGDLPRTSGEIRLDGNKPVGERPDRSVAAGLAIITEDRRKDGLSEDRPIVDNTSLPALAWLSRFGFVRKHLERKDARASLEKYGVKYAHIDDPVRSLSGGNQQKVVLAKWGMNQPRVYLLDEPTVGVDIGAKESIYNHIRDLAAEGAAVLLVSSYLPEVMGMSHRILVVRNGELVGEVIPAQTSEQELVEMASGVSAHE